MTVPREYLLAELAEQDAKIAILQEENDRLKSFARAVIQTMWDGVIDNCDVQDMAEKNGLIESTIATEDDAEIYDHISPGDTYFRFADWLKEKAQ